MGRRGGPDGQAGPTPREGLLDACQLRATARQEQALELLLQGCSNSEIAAEMKLGVSSVKCLLRRVYLQAGIEGKRKRVALARVLRGNGAVSCRDLTASELEIALLVYQGRSNSEIGAMLHIPENMVKHRLYAVFNRMGVWSRLELALRMEVSRSTKVVAD